MSNFKSKDLFKYYDSQPDDLQIIVDRHMGVLENGSRDKYAVCKAFLVEVTGVGFTFDYGLDGAPFNLRKLE